MLFRIALFAAAAAAIVFGWCQLARFSHTPGEQAVAPALLPSNLGLPGLDRHAVLLVFIHPQCSCTQATLQQLDRLLADLPVADRGIAPQLVLAVYDSAATRARRPFQPANWLHRPYRIFLDTGGRLARRFGAATSGEIILYSPIRRLLFQGGITPERTQTGDSPGLSSLRNALVSGHPAPLPSQPDSVFGCPIFRLEQAG